MKEALAKYLEYLQSVRNSSPHTVLNYRKDLEQFVAFSVAAGGPAAGSYGRHARADS